MKRYSFKANKRQPRRTAMQWFTLQRVTLLTPDLIKPTSLFDWRYSRELARTARTKPSRSTIGVIRAFGCKHFFAGCYSGAEFD